MTNKTAQAALKSGNNAVITGGANGIGLATASRLISQGLNVAIADRDEAQLSEALAQLRDQAGDGVKVEGFACDVSDASQVGELKQLVDSQLGATSVLMCNAGTAANPGAPWENADQWTTLLGVNLGGVINGVQAFVPDMLASGDAGLVINTGSKQGITRPPGNAAYNLSKAGVISFTESIAHAFRQIEYCQLSAHLLVPGFTYSGMISQFLPEKPAGAWTCDQVVDLMMERLCDGDFYIICPDNDVTPEMDAKRMQWYMDDLIQNRPALSRWHPDYEEAFAAFMET